MQTSFVKKWRRQKPVSGNMFSVQVKWKVYGFPAAAAGTELHCWFYVQRINADHWSGWKHSWTGGIRKEWCATTESIGRNSALQCYGLPMKKCWQTYTGWQPSWKIGLRRRQVLRSNVLRYSDSLSLPHEAGRGKCFEQSESPKDGWGNAASRFLSTPFW